MALSSLDLILLAQKYRGDVTPQINRRAVTLQMLGATEDGGKNCAWGFETSGQLARAIVEGADTTTFGADAQFPATLEWGIYEFPIGMTNLAMAGSRSSGGDPNANNDYWAKHIQNGLAALASSLNVDLYRGDGVGSAGERTLCGFGEIYGSLTNTYAGRDRTQAANALLLPNVFAPGTPTPFTLKMFRDDLGTIYEACGERPDLAFCKTAVFNMIGSRFDNVREYEQSTLTTGRGTITLDGSARIIWVDGCKVIEDKDATYAADTATSGSLTYVNSFYTELKVLPPANELNDIVKSRPKFRLNDGRDAIMLNVAYEALAKTGATEKGRGEIMLQLQCRRPNSGGVRTDIAIG
jgi:hypothetical protein